ncbi:MAG: tetratricopeptide repeat protein [Rikenellaceae bacterium]|nr:tetratricopeptide repeat protein [Rikenellaceae bacterium]
MKKLYLIYILTLLALPVAAQSFMEGTGEVRNLDIKRNGKDVTINMDIDISNLKVGADETVILTPMIEKGDKSLELPAVEVMGRRAWLYFLRNGENTATENPFYAERKAKRAERKAGVKQSVPYSTDLNFEEWMRGATVKMKEGSCGCDPQVIALGEDNVGNFHNEIYNPQYVLSYIEPDPEPIKVREKSLTAYINFYVDKYNIVEKYKNNEGELAAMIKSIKDVDNDKDLTISSITIEGWASPEATQQHNQVLSQNRANSLANYVSEKTGIERSHIEAIGRGEDWAGLKREVEATPMLLDQKKVLAIIDREDLTQDQKDKMLEDLIPPTIYQRLMNELYPRLRRNDYRIEYNVRNFNLEEARALVDSDPEKLSVSEIYKVAGSYERGSKEYNHALEVAAKTYPKNVAAAVNQAAILLAQNDYDGALDMLQKSQTDDARIQAIAGNIYIAKGDQAKAREAWTKAAAQGNADAKKNLEELDKHLKSL